MSDFFLAAHFNRVIEGYSPNHMGNGWGTCGNPVDMFSGYTVSFRGCEPVAIGKLTPAENFPTYTLTTWGRRVSSVHVTGRLQFPILIIS